LADAGEEVQTLRRLKTIGNFAIVRGEVMQDRWEGAEPVPQAKVSAHRLSDGLSFVSTTDAAGHYEFQPLPAGEFKIVVDPIGSFQADDGAVDATPGACWDLLISRSPHAQIGGFVTRLNGSPAAAVDVVLISAANTSYTTTQTDSEGHFEFRSELPGEFVVGLNYPPRSDWINGGGGGAGVKLPPASIFYPGVLDRREAGVIRLATDQSIDDINFTIPVK